MTFIVEPARPGEQTEAFRLALQHLPAREQVSRIQRALELVANGHIDPRGILVARAAGQLVGALVCMTTPGAGSLIWPPQTTVSSGNAQLIEDQLVGNALPWLQLQGAKLAQAMVHPDEAHLANPLLRHGFAHVTTLRYLSLTLKKRSVPSADGTLTWSSYRDQPALFEQTLLETYRGSEDCPELNGVRDIREIIEGHRAMGIHEPDQWSLAMRDDHPVGVLLLCRMPEWESMDVAYVGVVPLYRRRGIGRQLMARAMSEAGQRNIEQLTLAVDRRNRSAGNLYESLGFKAFDEREVFLAIWSRSATAKLN
jgi:GNAT superfamily N-acetyltransferase